MRKQRTIQEKIEQQMYCFGGGGGGGGGGGTRSPDPTRQPGANTRVDSRGNTVNFNTGPSKGATTGFGTPEQKANYTKTLPNGVQVVDYSTPFAGQVNLSGRGSSFGSLGQGIAEQGLKNPEVFAPITGTTSINPANFTNMTALGAPTEFGSFGQQINDLQRSVTSTNPAQALQDAIQGGRLNLGSGFYAGKTPLGGFGLGFESTFAQGGEVKNPVNAGIGSLGLPGIIK